jgi:rod shape-determining protein MreD
VIASYQKKFLTTVWFAFGTGLLLDLLSAKTPLGFYALIYCIGVTLLGRLKRHFFADTPTTLPIMVWLFSLIVTTLQASFYPLFGSGLSLGSGFFVWDILLYPLLDAVFAFTILIAPPLFMGKRSMRAEDFFD